MTTTQEDALLKLNALAERRKMLEIELMYYLGDIRMFSEKLVEEGLERDAKELNRAREMYVEYKNIYPTMVGMMKGAE